MGEISVLEQKISEKSRRGNDTHMAKGNLKKSPFFLGFFLSFFIFKLIIFNLSLILNLYYPFIFNYFSYVSQ